MYICNCNGITERQIQGAVDLGCASLEDLTRDLGVGSCCGKCVPDACKLLRRCGVGNGLQSLGNGDD
jgi:bacterioferritin-associated ferredoxin